MNQAEKDFSLDNIVYPNITIDNEKSVKTNENSMEHTNELNLTGEAR